MHIFSNQFLPWWILGHILIKKQELHNMHKKTNTLAMNVIEDRGENWIKESSPMVASIHLRASEEQRIPHECLCQKR